jgi:hypothetical protein
MKSSDLGIPTCPCHTDAMSTALRFDVFGRIYSIERTGSRWVVLLHGADGKRGPAGFVVPDFIPEDELEQYLYDLFHESATPTNGEVRRLS